MKAIIFNGESFEIPFRLTCTVSGQVKVYTLQSFIEKKITRFGGLEKLRATYVCKDAKRLMKEGKSVEEIKEILNKELTQRLERNALKMISPKVKKEDPIVIEVVELPLAKKDKRGLWRNEKGHIISKDNISNYRMVAE